ncbi:holo-ACP synthase [Natronospora cellulosivora (SeqCode)]
MIKGLGVDLVKIKRIEEVHQRKGDVFLEKIFTPIEIKYCKSKSRPYQHYAARFAIKEAVIKMLGKSEGFTWQDIEVENKDNGKPKLNLRANAKKLAEELGIERIHISISHEKELAIAQVIGEGGA